jgi:hypothetical protein
MSILCYLPLVLEPRKRWRLFIGTKKMEIIYWYPGE